MHSFADTPLKNLYTLKKIRIQTRMNAYEDFHVFACISVIKTCVTDLVLKNKNAISHYCGLLFNASYYRHTTQKLASTKINTYSNEMNA